MLQTQPAVYLYSLSTAVDGEGRGCALQGGDGGGAGVGGGGGGEAGRPPVQQELASSLSLCLTGFNLLLILQLLLVIKYFSPGEYSG